MNDNPYSPPGLNAGSSVSRQRWSRRFILRLTLVSAGAGLVAGCWHLACDALLDLLQIPQTSRVAQLLSPIYLSIPSWAVGAGFGGPRHQTGDGPFRSKRTFAVTVFALACFSSMLWVQFNAVMVAGSILDNWVFELSCSLIQHSPPMFLTLGFVSASNADSIRWSRLISATIAAFGLYTAVAGILTVSVINRMLPDVTLYGFSILRAVVWVLAVGCLLPFLVTTADEIPTTPRRAP